MHPLPRYRLDPASIIALPPGRTVGPVTGVQLTSDGHLWVLHMAGHMEYQGFIDSADPAERMPPLMEFDASGKFLQAWGGPDHLPPVDRVAQWPLNEETISVDAEDTIWVFGANKEHDHAVQRFTRDGKLLLRIGAFGQVGTNDSTDRLGTPTDCHHDVEHREVYISDGYVNQRIAVFDSDTGQFKRAWGADGRWPIPSGNGRENFNVAHAICLGPDGLLYMSDRKNDRLQVFDAIGRSEPRFVRELRIDEPSPHGTVQNVSFTPGGDFMLVNDGNNERIWIVDFHAWKLVGDFHGPMDAGERPGGTIHKIIRAPNGDLILGRTRKGVQRLAFLGIG